MKKKKNQLKSLNGKDKMTKRDLSMTKKKNKIKKRKKKSLIKFYPVAEKYIYI